MNRSRRFRVYLVGAGLLVVLLATGVYVFMNNRSNEKYVPATEGRLEQVQQNAIPAADEDKITYYARLGNAYYEAGKYQKALESFLEADKFVALQTSADAEYARSVNFSIAQSYDKTGNKAKAREYYQREIDRIKSSAEPDTEAISNLEKRRDNL